MSLFAPIAARGVPLTALVASAGLAPGDVIETKEAPNMEAALRDHIAVVTKALDDLQKTDKSVEEKVREHDALIVELSQKQARSERGGGPGSALSIGQQFATAEGLRSFAAEQHRKGTFRMEVKTVTSGAGSGGGLVSPQRDDVVMKPRRRLVIRDLLRIINTQTGLVQYPYQTARTNNAAPVAETNLKPESSYTWDLKDVPIRTIAHWVEASRQILDDAPQLEGLIDEELSYGLALLEEAQLLFGDGTGQNLNGFVPQATAYAAPFAIGDATMIDKVGLAILQSALTDVEPDGVVMHPSDWMRIRLTKDGDGNYIYGPPGVAVTPSIFGKPVVPTTAMTIDKFLTGPFETGATLYDRMAPTIMASTEDRDNFIRNKVTILAEERVGFADKLPTSFIFGDFGNVA